MVNPGFHSVPSGPERPDFGAAGTSAAKVLFLGLAALTATFAIMESLLRPAWRRGWDHRWPLQYHQQYRHRVMGTSFMITKDLLLPAVVNPSRSWKSPRFCNPATTAYTGERRRPLDAVARDGRRLRIRSGHPAQVN